MPKRQGIKGNLHTHIFIHRGVFDEVGPCKVNAEGTEVEYHEIGSWNKISNMLFLDQPTGTGFSYGDRKANTTDKAKLRAYQFLQLFFEAFPKYQKQVFHLFGESYSGHYIPAIADYILEMNRSPNLPPNQYINLESIGIGNGITDVLIQDQYAETMACHSSYGSVLSQEDCDEMKDNIPRCTELMQICEDTGTEKDCYKATTYCARHVEDIYLRSGRDIYDIRASRNDNSSSQFAKFLNIPEVRSMIGGKVRFHHCLSSIKNAFYKTGDYARNYAPTVGKLLDNGIRVLLFAGDADYRANWYGGHGWTQVFDFNASQSYRTQPFNPWIIDGAEAGQIKSGGNLTFIRVYEAGHKVAYYQPEACLQMFINHLAETPQ
ncbi:unnamed protein product [Absidia cylindrospora]